MKKNSNVKPISKFIAFVTAFTSIAASSGLTAFAAEEAPAFTEVKLPALVNSFENVAEFDCRYYSETPNVPYMRLSDYYSLYTGQELTITNNDGSYEVVVPFGMVGTFDVENDTLNTEDKNGFFMPEKLLTGEDSSSKVFVRTTESTTEEVPAEYIIDFGKYDIDLIGDGEELWLPIPTLCDLYSTEVTSSVFADDTLILGDAMLGSMGPLAIAQSPDHLTNQINQYANGRPADLAEYNYNELCLYFDITYGAPGRPYYTDLMVEKGLDGFLSEANDTTRIIKKQLLSTDYAEYLCGFDMLNFYLWDGGHTQFGALPAMFDQELAAKVQNVATSAGYTLENIYDYMSESLSKQASAQAIAAAREATVANADTFEMFDSGAVYIVKDNTAIFSFDQFVSDTDAWAEYYYEDAEMPKDVISDFYNCLMAADANPDVDNFLIDVSTNGGGQVIVMHYIMGTIADADTYNTSTENTITNSKFEVDKNLDKVFDSKDDEFKTDLRFGVISSLNSYSSGNLLPTVARDNDIMIIGEQSGGGGCATFHRLTADGLFYSLSKRVCFLNENNESVDAGVVPDFETFTVNEDGTKDFSETYNFESLSKYFDEFYGTEAVTTTTTATTSDTTTTTTTTTAVVEDTDTTEDTTTEATTTESTTEDTTTAATTTTTPETTTQPVVNATSDENLCSWAINDYYIKTGNMAHKAEITSKGDVYEITLTCGEGTVLDVYTIDPVTGVGTSGTGDEVNLPQTGTLSLNNLFIVLGAFAMTVCGFFAVMASGIFRRKTDEE